MASSITLYDDAGNPVVLDGETMKGGGGLGFGQTWQDMTASRVVGTTYTNNTGKPIQVAAGMLEPASSAWVNFLINGVAVTQARSTTTNQRFTFEVVVPDGDSYALITAGTGYTDIWSELRGV